MQDGIIIDTLPSLPEPTSDSCLMIIDDDSILMAGGYTPNTATGAAYMFRYDNEPSSRT